jgi:hypothetical protein
VLTALIAFFPTPGNGAIGSLEYSSHERKEYASRSSAYRCELCEKTNLELLPDLPPGVLEREGAPKLAKEVQDTLDANKHIAALVPPGGSAPATPAHGPLSVPPTPVNVAQGKKIVEAMPPSNPTSPSFVRSVSEPIGQRQGEQRATPSAASSSSSAAGVSSPGLAPLVLDEGLRQRQGRVTLPNVEEAQGAAVPAAVAPVAPAAAAVPQVQLVRPPPENKLSAVTVFLAFLIMLILMRKLYASSQAKAAFSYDFSQD